MRRSHPICHDRLNTWNQSSVVAFVVGGQFSPHGFILKMRFGVFFCMFSISSNFTSACIGKDNQLGAMGGELP